MQPIADDPIIAHATREWKSTPKMRVEDAYKWLYQARMGGEHAIGDEDGARRWLHDEWGTLGSPMKGEPLIVKLRPDGSLIRVNLRPYKANGGDQKSLLEAFVESAMQFKPDLEHFKKAWLALMNISPMGPISPIAWEKLDKVARTNGYPPMHHSPEYTKAYRPAYRILRSSEWQILSAKWRL